MAGIDPNNLNVRLAAVHQALIDGGKPTEKTTDAEKLAEAKAVLEHLQADISTTGELAA